MKRFKLDTSLIPPAKMGDPRLTGMLEKGRDACVLMDCREYRIRICVHEVAHELYYRRAGATDFDRCGPVILYDEITDTFDLGTAGIRPRWQGANADLGSIARAHVAGWISEFRLTDFDDPDGAGQDLEVFRGYWCPRFGVVDEADILEEWEKARQEVLKDLRSPALRRQIWALAFSFQDWLLENCTDET